jgi:soluble lytic murein transglycosylase-like protein
MVPKTQWTIQDYLKHAGMAAEVHRRKSTAGSADDGRSDFARILADSQGGTQNKAAVAAGGRRLADYLKAPVLARVPKPSGRTSSVPSGTDRVAAPAAGPSGDQRVPPEALDQSAPLAESRTKATSSSKTPAIQHPTTADGVAQRIEDSIAKAASDYDLPAELIRGVIQAESNFQARAVSPAGAQGLMQLMPATARELGVDDPFDIEQNIDGGARYLRQMLDMFGGDVKQALSAYNAGPGTVLKYDGQVPYPETRHYVRKVMLYAQR